METFGGVQVRPDEGDVVFAPSDPGRDQVAYDAGQVVLARAIYFGGFTALAILTAALCASGPNELLGVFVVAAVTAVFLPSAVTLVNPAIAPARLRVVRGTLRIAAPTTTGYRASPRPATVQADGRPFEGLREIVLGETLSPEVFEVLLVSDDAVLRLARVAGRADAERLVAALAEASQVPWREAEIRPLFTYTRKARFEKPRRVARLGACALAGAIVFGAGEPGLGAFVFVIALFVTELVLDRRLVAAAQAEADERLRAISGVEPRAPSETRA